MKKYTSVLIIALMLMLTGCASTADAVDTIDTAVPQVDKKDSTSSEGTMKIQPIEITPEREAVEALAIDYLKQANLPEVASIDVLKISNRVPGEYRVKAVIIYKNQTPDVEPLDESDLTIHIQDGKPAVTAVEYM